MLDEADGDVGVLDFAAVGEEELPEVGCALLVEEVAEGVEEAGEGVVEGGADGEPEDPAG